MLKIAYHELYNHPLEKKHRFPMEKYDLIHQQLLYEGTCEKENFFTPEIPNNKHFFPVHDPEYFFDLLNITISKEMERRIGFPICERLIQREMLIADGSIKAAKYAIKYGIAMNIAGGTHHAFSDKGEGFCMINDQAVAAKYLQNNKLADKVLIVDLDVHQGNGTAKIFEDDNSIFTFSMHGGKNYPFQKEKSDLDIPLESDITDNEYLSLLYETLPKLIKQEKPDFIFYLSGVDVLESDKLGKLNISLDGCKQRDEFVLQTCYNNNIPVMCSMGGGYSEDIRIIVEAHCNAYRLAQDIYF